MSQQYARTSSPTSIYLYYYLCGHSTRQMRQVERTCKRNHMEIEHNTAPDVLVRNEGTIFLFYPLTPQAKEWIDEHVQSDTQWFGDALVVEHRYAWGLAQVMKDDGLLLGSRFASLTSALYRSVNGPPRSKTLLPWNAHSSGISPMRSLFTFM
jgi:hypothetical protein